MNENIEHVASQVDDGVLHIEIRRPEKRNALTMPMFSALTASLSRADADPEVRTILVSGAGQTFCAGHDLAAFEQWPQSAQDPVPRFLHAIAAVRKPVVVAVHGAAAGIGVTWLLHADWIVGAPQASLKLPFADLGIAPEAASSLLLARAIGSHRARRLLMGGEAFTAAQAHEWGLVTELAEPDAVLDVARTRARMLAAKDPQTLRTIKGLLHPSGEFDEQIDVEIQAINDAVLRRRSDSN